MLQGSEDGSLEVRVRHVDVEILPLTHEDHDWHRAHILEGDGAYFCWLELRVQVVNLIVHGGQQLANVDHHVAEHETEEENGA